MPTVRQGQTVTVSVLAGQWVAVKASGDASVLIPLGQPGGPVSVLSGDCGRYGPFSLASVVSVTSVSGETLVSVGAIASPETQVMFVDVTSGNPATIIQRALDAAMRSGRRSTRIAIQSNGQITLPSGIVLDPYYHDVDFLGADVVYTPTTGTAITLNGSVPNAFTQLVGGVSGINLHGPVSGSPIGMAFTGSATGARTSSVNAKVAVSGFDVGIDFQNYGYLTHFHGLVIDSFVSVGLRQSIGTDAGENISVHGGQISNGQGVAIQGLDDTTEINLHGVSLDYNVKTIDLRNGRITMFDGHIEFQGTTAGTDHIRVQGQSSFRMKYGYWVVNTGAGNGPYTYPYLVNVVDSNSEVIFDGVHMVNHRNTVDTWAVGAGKVRTNDLIFFDNSLMPYSMFAANSRLIDGYGEQTTVKDYWYVYSDATGAGSSRLVGGSGLSVSTDTSNFLEGSRSIRLHKGNVGTTTGSVLAIAFPLGAGNIGRRCLIDAWMMSSSSNGGATLMSLYWGALRKQDANERPVWDQETAYAVNFYNQEIPTSWTQTPTNNGSLVIPPYATHLELRIDITAITALASIWIDKLKFEIV